MAKIKNNDVLPIISTATRGETIPVVLAERGFVRVPEFPADSSKYLAFLSNFGQPLNYYGDASGAHPSASSIWRVRYHPEQAARREQHAIDGPLSLHSSQSLRNPRPPYFSMLMVDNGWQDNPGRANGASLFVRWSDALQRINSVVPDSYPGILGALQSGVPYPDGVVRPVVYQLRSARNTFDLGVRLKSDLLEYLQAQFPDHPATRAVLLLSEAALEVAGSVQLRSGDLVLLDNNRWGHGREPVVGRRQLSGGNAVSNPRELWSVTIG